MENPEDILLKRAESSRVNAQIWQSTFLDIILLLLSFFVIVAGIARFNVFETTVDNIEDQVYTEQQKSITALLGVLSEVLGNEIESDLINIEQNQNELRVSLNSSLFYKTGEAELIPDGKELVYLITENLKLVQENDFNIDIEGHTDDRPINSNFFNSNWDLSAIRASNVVEIFVENGIEKNRLKAVGFSDSRPLLANRDSLGNPILENMDKNRRFDIRIYY